MADRYQTIIKKRNESVNQDPVIIDSYAVLKDTKEDKTLAQLKLKNQGPLAVKECHVLVKDTSSGDILSEYTFQNLNVAADSFFGSNTPIQIPDGTADILPMINKVIFSDQSTWTPAEEKTLEAAAESVSEDALPELITEDDELPGMDSNTQDDELPDMDSISENDVTSPAESIDSTAEASAEDTTPVSQPSKKRNNKLVFLAAAGVLVIGAVLYFLFGWKSQAVRNTEKMISSIEDTSYESKAEIESARAAYNALSDKEKKRVSNYDQLQSAEKELEVAAEAYYQKTKIIYAKQLDEVHNACMGIWYGDILIMQHAGEEYVSAIRKCIKMFNKDQSFSQYGESMRDYLWMAAYGVCPDAISGSKIKTGKEQTIVDNCVVYNETWATMETAKRLQKEVDAFADEFSSQHPDETSLLSKWASALADTESYLQNPTGDLETTLETALSFSKLRVSMHETFDID